jgi:hypothetical protein
LVLATLTLILALILATLVLTRLVLAALTLRRFLLAFTLALIAALVSALFHAAALLLTTIAIVHLSILLFVGTNRFDCRSTPRAASKAGAALDFRCSGAHIAKPESSGRFPAALV